ncbi:MAG: radical SAM protein [Candidatus Micrarchaeaceae archaeon]
MKILFVSPPTISAIRDIIGTTGPPLGLAYLAAVARDKGHEVKIVDALADNLTFDDVKKTISLYSPDIVAITSTTSMIPDAYNIAKIAKEVSKNIITMIGGPHATFVPAMVLQECNDMDFVIKGEGELVFSNLLDALAKGKKLEEVKGISYRHGGMIKDNMPEMLINNIDTLPMPALDLLPMDKYEVDGTQFGTVMTSRGCPYNCIFCSSSLQFGKRWRGHSVDRVIEELKILREKYKKKEIEFLDDTFTLNMNRALELTKRINEEGLDISWSASARVNLFSDEIAASMKKAGAHTIYFGIESASQETLNFIGKGITPELAMRAVEKATNAGLHSLGSFIIGFPEETKDDVNKTLSFSKKIGVTFAQFTIATPYPGTRLWDYVIKNGLLLTKNWRMYTTLSPVIRLKNFTSKEILKKLTYAYVSFYARPLFLLKDIFQNKGFIFKRLISYSKKIMSSNSLRESFYG